MYWPHSTVYTLFRINREYLLDDEQIGERDVFKERAGAHRREFQFASATASSRTERVGSLKTVLWIRIYIV